MKTLFVYYSMSGNLKLVAKELEKNAGVDLLRIYPESAYPKSGAKKFLWGGKSALTGEAPKLQPYIFDADKYDAVILGYPVWAETFSPPIRSFVNENREALSDKKLGAVACSMGSGGEKSLEKLRKFADIDSWYASISLTEPKKGLSEADAKALAEFCEMFSGGAEND